MRFAAFFILIFLFSACTSEVDEVYSEQKEAIEKKLPVLLVHTPDVQPKHINELKAHLEKAFPFHCSLIKSSNLPKKLLSTIRPNRYRADSILRYLGTTYKGQGLKTILITNQPISCTKTVKVHGIKKIKEPRARYIDWGIFGLGSCPGYTCVVSGAFLWARNANEKTFLRRLKNVSVHELGHTFGLPHCPEPHCVMNDANETIVTVDKSTGLFCGKCKKQLAL